jgi:two-component system cell cycle sensor histidine kinase/response regulator CckA
MEGWTPAMGAGSRHSRATGVALLVGNVFIPFPMTGWFAQNTDYLLFLLLVGALWLGLGVWLARSERLGSLPKAIWLLLVVVLGGGWWAVNRAGIDAQRELRRQVELLVPFYVQEMQQAGHARLSDNPTPDDPLYLELIQAEINWLKLNPAIADIYTFRRRADGAIFLLVDSETDYDRNGRLEGDREQRTTPGELYEGMTPSLTRAFRGETVFDDEIVTDRWGTWVSALAPLRNSAGAVEAVLGVDFDAAQWIHQRAGARRAWLWLLGGAVLFLTGPAVLIAVLRHDLERRRLVELQLREQGELRRMIFDHAPGGVALASLDFHLIEVNEAFCRMLGYRRDELLQMTFLQITHPDDLEKTRANNQQVRDTGEAPPLDQRYIRKDGSLVHVQVRMGLARNASGAPLYLVGQITDVTERRLVESQLAEHQRQLTTVLAHAPVILFAIDANGVYTLAEGAGLSAIGRQPGDAVGHSAFDRYAARPDIVGDVRRALAGETFTVQREINGVMFETRCTPQRDAEGRITGMIGLSIDISDRLAVAREREKIEHKLLDVQKLESLGVLAGGVAHDFNNLLTAIMGNANLARLTLPAGAKASSHLNQIEQTSQLAAGLCQQLLAYAGRGRLDTRATNLNTLVRETTELLRLAGGANAHLRFNLAPELPAILADPAQIRQVLLNIVQNAAEAIGRREGAIDVSTRLAAIDAAWLAEASTGQHLPPGSYVCLEITDNGPGLDPATRARIFDPFFSTKGNGRGLGLAAALGIMRSHQGALKLATEPGRGATFTLAFPIHHQPAAKPAAASPSPRTWRGSGTVLIVDDEESVRATAAQMIAFYGFTVKQADSGQQAIDLLRQRGSRFDLVLLDLTMPGMDGYATFTALRQLQPEQRIVVFSGYSAQDAQQRFAGQNLNGFLQKPFSAESLRQALQAAI